MGTTACLRSSPGKCSVWKLSLEKAGTRAKLTLLGESWVEAVKGTARRGASSRGKEERAPVVHGLMNGRDGKDGTPGGTSGHTVHSPH